MSPHFTRSTHPLHSTHSNSPNSFTLNCLPHSLTTHPLTHSPTPSLTHSLPHSLTHSLAHSGSSLLHLFLPLKASCGVLRLFNFLPTSQVRLSRFCVWRRLPISFHLWFWATLAKNVCTCKGPHVLHFPKYAKAHGAQARTHLRKRAPHTPVFLRDLLKTETRGTFWPRGSTNVAADVSRYPNRTVLFYDRKSPKCDHNLGKNEAIPYCKPHWQLRGRIHALLLIEWKLRRFRPSHFYRLAFIIGLWRRRWKYIDAETETTNNLAIAKAWLKILPCPAWISSLTQNQQNERVSNCEAWARRNPDKHPSVLSALRFM